MFLLKIYLPNYVDSGFFIKAIKYYTLNFKKKMKFVSLRLKVQWWVVKGYKLQYIIYLDLPSHFLLLGCDGPVEAFSPPTL